MAGQGAGEFDGDGLEDMASVVGVPVQVEDPDVLHVNEHQADAPYPAQGRRSRRGLPERHRPRAAAGHDADTRRARAPRTTACTVCDAAEALLPILAHGHDDVPAPGAAKAAAVQFADRWHGGPVRQVTNSRDMWRRGRGGPTGVVPLIRFPPKETFSEVV